MATTYPRRFLAVALVALAVSGVAVAAVLVGRSDGYSVKVAMPNAIGVVAGTPVQVAGREAGRVSSVAVQDDHAVVVVTIDPSSAPLHTGTTVAVRAESVLGERYLDVRPGPVENATLPDGALIAAGTSQVLVEDVLEALDPETRAHLSSLVEQLDATLVEPVAGDVNRTVQAAGPGVEALGAVLDAVGQDGPAIRGLVTNLRNVAQVLADRDAEVASTVEDLNHLTGTVAVHHRQLADALAELPPTLDTVQGLLDRFPAATDELVPLLEDLRPAADRLPGVAANLDPVLDDLRPAVATLRPTLAAADRLLGRTPAFTDETTDVLPEVQTTMERLAPVVAFLRPYTPEAMGFASNWGNLFSTYDSQGHFAHPIVTTGKTALDDNPNVTIPGESVSSVRLPGENVGQPWTDASGSGPR